MFCRVTQHNNNKSFLSFSQVSNQSLSGRTVDCSLLTMICCRRRRAAGNGGRHSSRRSRSSHRSRSGGGGRRGGTPGPVRRSSRSPARSRRSRSEAGGELEPRDQVGCWPHGQSFLFASLGVVMGMFSISRFVVLTLDFGGKSGGWRVVGGVRFFYCKKTNNEKQREKHEQIIHIWPHLHQGLKREK